MSRAQEFNFTEDSVIDAIDTDSNPLRLDVAQCSYLASKSGLPHSDFILTDIRRAVVDCLHTAGGGDMITTGLSAEGELTYIYEIWDANGDRKLSEGSVSRTAVCTTLH
jgi:hypothetical protein